MLFAVHRTFLRVFDIVPDNAISSVPVLAADGDPRNQKCKKFTNAHKF